MECEVGLTSRPAVGPLSRPPIQLVVKFSPVSTYLQLHGRWRVWRASGGGRQRSATRQQRAGATTGLTLEWDGLRVEERTQAGVLLVLQGSVLASALANRPGVSSPHTTLVVPALLHSAFPFSLVAGCPNLLPHSAPAALLQPTRGRRSGGRGGSSQPAVHGQQRPGWQAGHQHHLQAGGPQVSGSAAAATTTARNAAATAVAAIEQPWCSLHSTAAVALPWMTAHLHHE